MKRQKTSKLELQKLLEACLAAFIRAGTIDLSLDQLATEVGTSKRMLIHYFQGREEIEEGTMAMLEERLRKQFAPEAFPAGMSLTSVVAALWRQTTAPESRGVLLLVMDLSRRAWSGSARAKAFYAEQQRLWVQLLMNYLPNRPAVEELLQLFQGAVLAYLITGDPEPGGSSLMRFLSQPQRAS
ncbi:MAG: TetR/AcrR family transcriptional regulator [Acidobacteriaceae bacterium]|nr:TetR/AcrR family transcriptional regulator [Acidobacteriaceae bacterium]